MKTPLKLLHLRQIEERTLPWRPLVTQRPPRGGWIQVIRKALGMTTSQLAHRLGIGTRQGVVDLERRERGGNVTLATLAKAAEAMECDLVYAVVPRVPLPEMLRNRARAIAAERLGRVAHSMKLEEQPVTSEEHDRQVDDLAAEILRDSARVLWDEETA